MLVTTAFTRASQAIVIECRGAEWILDTGLVRKVVRLEGGQLGLVSFRNEVSGHEYVTATQPSPEIRLSVDGTVITGRTGGWTLISNRVRQLGPGQWQLDLKLQRETIEVEKHYLAYTDTPIIREWLTITNVGGRALKVEAPCFLAANLLSSETKDLDLSYVTGGGEYLGSQLLKTEPMSAGYSRVFDSQIRIQTNEYRGTCYGVYLPLLVQRNRHTHDGIMVGWDYLGHWTLQVGVDSATGSCGNISLQIAGYSKMLESGRCIETPKAFIGAFTGDLDAMGNTLLDWQYLDLWDYTNDNYFARTRWAVNWTGTWLGDGGTPSGDNWGRRLADDLRYIDLMREAGGDILWDDAGWYDKFGSWQAPEWRLTNEYLAKYNMRWVLWFPTYLALPTSRVGQEHPEWLILDKDGKHARMTRDLATLCPAVPEVQAFYKKLTEKFIGDWGFDGSKLDNIYSVPMCYNPAHHHKSPQDSVNAVADVYKTIFQTSRALKPESVTQSCPCGTPPSLAWLPFLDQAVTADPVGAVQVRRRIKMYKALLGPESAVYGDHVELSTMDRIGNNWREHGEDFASTIGAGGVVGTKFVWPDPGPKFKDVALTQEKEEHWKKWIDIYNQKMLSKGSFRNLYVYGYDAPEGYAIEKEGKMNYAFFAPSAASWKGEIELRGLAPGSYHVRDYAEGKDLGTVEATAVAPPKLKTEFKDHLLLEVGK